MKRAAQSTFNDGSRIGSVDIDARRVHVLQAVRWLENAKVIVCAIERLEHDLFDLVRTRNQQPGASTNVESDIDTWLRDCLRGLQSRVDVSFELLSQSTHHDSHTQNVMEKEDMQKKSTHMENVYSAPHEGDVSSGLVSGAASPHALVSKPTTESGHVVAIAYDQQISEQNPQLCTISGIDGHLYSKKQRTVVQSSAFVDKLKKDFGITAIPCDEFRYNLPASRCSHCSKVLANTTRGWKNHVKTCVNLHTN